MSRALKSLIECGTKLWLDSIDPKLVEEKLCPSGPPAPPPIRSSSPTCSSRAGFDDRLRELSAEGLSDSEVAWKMTDELVSAAEQVFLRCGNVPLATMATSALNSNRSSKTRN